MQFFFSSRRRHTRYWRDWSSDVCSSDLGEVLRHAEAQLAERGERPGGAPELHDQDAAPQLPQAAHLAGDERQPARGLEPRSEERRVGEECRSRWSPYY